MTTVSTKSGKVVKVVSRGEEKNTLTVSDNEMDETTESIANDIKCKPQNRHSELLFGMVF